MSDNEVGTGHRAQGTGHRAQGTGQGAQGKEHRAVGSLSRKAMKSRPFVGIANYRNDPKEE